jgi:hypothetical protein
MFTRTYYWCRRHNRWARTVFGWGLMCPEGGKTCRKVWDIRTKKVR